MASSYVQVTGVPASASPQELRDLFGQLGEVVHVVASFEGGAEGRALVVYSDPAAAEEAVDLLDSYPMGTSLLEVQTVNLHNFVGQLASRMLGMAAAPATPAEAAPAAPAAAAPAAAANGSGGSSAAGVAALEAEMRELQLQLQAQAEAGGMADWVAADEPSFEAEAQEEDNGWQVAARPPRRAPSHGSGHAGAAGAAASSARGPPAGGQGTWAPNTALWIGSIGSQVEPEHLARAMSRWGWGPVHVEKLVQASETAPGTRRYYKWGIVRFPSPQAAAAAKEALDRQRPAELTDIPLKVTHYDPGHGRSKRR